jgi:long-chain fatty acid transport protein
MGQVRNYATELELRAECLSYEDWQDRPTRPGWDRVPDELVSLRNMGPTACRLAYSGVVGNHSQEQEVIKKGEVGMDTNPAVCTDTISSRFRRYHVLLAFVLALITPTATYATNGLNQIGFGTESVGMGGADIAVARDTSALNTNPAGLSQIEEALADTNFAVAYTGNIRHEDQFGNDKNNSNKYPVLGSLGYVRQLPRYPIRAGIGLFAQGGTGNEFNNLHTAFGTRDDLSIQFRVARITPGLAWQVNDRLSLGASIVGTYADLEQKVFPNTSVFNPADPSQSFFGFELENMNDFNAGIKLGLMYKPTDRLTLGAAWNSKVDLNLEGRMRADLSALGLGKVNYRNAEAKNIDQPQELGVGAALQVTDRWLLSLELNWINWSDAVTTGIITASDPDNPAAPSKIKTAVDNDWRDQYVVAVGTVYQWNTKMLLRAGYNYGRNPIPDQHINPLLNTIAEHHLTLGFGHKLSDVWHIDGAFEWDIINKETYTNKQLPFGKNAEASGELFALHFRVSRVW